MKTLTPPPWTTFQSSQVKTGPRALFLICTTTKIDRIVFPRYVANGKDVGPYLLEINHIPLSVAMRQDHGEIRVAMHSSRVGSRMHRVEVDSGHWFEQVEKRFTRKPNHTALLFLEASECSVTYTFVHVVPLERKNGCLLALPRVDSFTWCEVQLLPQFVGDPVMGFLQRELRADPRFPCKFLPTEWTAREYRLVCEAITGLALDGSNAHKAVERMVRQGLVEPTGRKVATLTRPAVTYTAVPPSHQELAGSPWQWMPAK